jgi:hypothetical protein
MQEARDSKESQAQDDGFVGGLKYRWLDMQEHEKIEKVTGSRDDNSVCVVMNSLRQVTSFLPTLSQSNSRDICHIRNRSHIRNSARQHARH